MTMAVDRAFGRSHFNHHEASNRTVKCITAPSTRQYIKKQRYCVKTGKDRMNWFSLVKGDDFSAVAHRRYTSNKVMRIHMRRVFRWKPSYWSSGDRTLKTTCRKAWGLRRSRSIVVTTESNSIYLSANLWQLGHAVVRMFVLEY